MSEELTLKSEPFQDTIWTKAATITPDPCEHIEIQHMTYDAISDCFQVWINKEFRKYVREVIE